ncbi:hypothetical protein [Hyperthermus butylicus]|uniref:Uncharacterized protein n=1 Tax=Hyperthermus butylicus (strain DSM 5456 / JCM 9403 / PLM1-5) TaxID=415426 RepID=A2BJW3_HYPBU|nr:hypothetical protein [Hyperthermus butylicus]ABM80274.1 hypothetical protein Hbut_0408 [Hyperthermus butylicus DSM 5456]
MKEEVEPSQPEQWMRDILEYTASILQRSGFQAHPLTRLAHAAVAAAHITGFEPLYDYPVELYYELQEAAEKSALYTPRWRPAYQLLEEEVEALAAFEEALASSDTVFHTEPILAAAALGYGCRAVVSRDWLEAGFTPTPGQQIVIVRRGEKRARILVPRSLYTLALAGLTVYGVTPYSKALLPVPDPATIRKRVFMTKLPLGEASKRLVEIVDMYVKPVCRRVDENPLWACRSDTVLLIEYRFSGPIVLDVRYVYC